MPEPDINQFEIAAVRMRPAMYVGNVRDESSLAILLTESACLALDNVSSGCASEVAVTLASDGSASIRDNGPGLDVQPGKFGLSAIDVIFTRLHACREQKKDKLHAQELCSNGVAVTNALSEWMTYETTQDGAIWQQRYVKGIPTHSIESVGRSATPYQQLSFKPDPEIFPAGQLSAKPFVDWFHQLTLDLHSASITIQQANGVVTQLHPNTNTAS